MKPIIHLALAIIAIFSSITAFAATSGKTGGDLVIQSDKLNLNQNTKDSYFTGRVVVTQDDLLINSDDLLAHQDEAGEKHITLKGNPVTFKQLDQDGKWVNGQADMIVYDTKTKIMILTNHAKVTKDGDLVIGQQIKYNTVTKVYDVTSVNNSSRVTVILQDRNNSDKK
jgi:lipopolysaccharide transport protein LptA